jgi:hypothetical protein
MSSRSRRGTRIVHAMPDFRHPGESRDDVRGRTTSKRYGGTV